MNRNTLKIKDRKNINYRKHFAQQKVIKIFKNLKEVCKFEVKAHVLIPTLIKSNTTKSESSSDIAEELNNHFKRVFTTEDSSNIP